MKLTVTNSWPYQQCWYRIMKDKLCACPGGGGGGWGVWEIFQQAQNNEDVPPPERAGGKGRDILSCHEIMKVCACTGWGSGGQRRTLCGMKQSMYLCWMWYETSMRLYQMWYETRHVPVPESRQAWVGGIGSPLSFRMKQWRCVPIQYCGGMGGGGDGTDVFSWPACSCTGWGD